LLYVHALIKRDFVFGKRIVRWDLELSLPTPTHPNYKPMISNISAACT